MPNHLSEQVRECRERARHCARKASQQQNRQLQENYLRLEELWRNLAQSYEFTERAAFSNDAARQADKLQADKR